jgi:hypothetical protein
MWKHTYLGQARSLFLRLQLCLSRLLHLALQLTRSLKKKKKGEKFKKSAGISVSLKFPTSAAVWVHAFTLLDLLHLRILKK